MDDYIVSARKYRPDTFEMVVGQDAITQTLKNSIKNKQLGQAYLFCGPRGVGKTTCARIFAKTINCSSPTDSCEPCNECESCRAFNESRSFNIHELDAASNNSVEDIRALIDQVRIPPQLGSYSVYIIDEVHMLSPAAFNAFLKTLEEPPKHAIFILATTEKHKILPTILSRCQIFDFSRISVEDIRKQLEYVAQKEGIEADTEALHVIAQKADGAMRDALSIFDQIVSFCGRNITYQDTIKNLNVLDYEVYFQITDSLLSGNYSNALTIFDDVLKKGFEGGYFINGLASHYRDLLVCKDPGTLKLIEVGDKTKMKYQDYAQKCSEAFLFNAIQIANSCDLSYRTAQNKRLLVELALLKICNVSANVFEVQQQQQPKPAEAKSRSAQTENVRTNVVVEKSGEAQSTSSAVKPQNVSATQTVSAEQPVSSSEEPQEGHKGKEFLLKKIEGLNPVNANENKENAQGDDRISYGNKEYDLQAVVSAWNDFVVEKCPENTRWYSYLMNHSPEQNDSNQYEVKVENDVLQKNLMEKKHVIQNYIRKKIDNGSFEFSFVVDESLAAKNIVTVKSPSEQLSDIRKNNPDVAGLISDSDFSQA